MKIMRQDKLTKVERQFALTANDPELLACPELWPEMREYIREIAYHEAGHLAAQVFAREGDGWKSGTSRTTGASIIPDLDSMGRVTVTAGGAVGYAFLLDMLAGRAVDKRMSVTPHRKEILDPKCRDWNQEETDLFRAARAADIMARPGMPARRILALAEKWTIEMLALPDVWRAVETLAGMLIERGSIEADDILAVCDTVTPARDLPKWRRRLCLIKA